MVPFTVAVSDIVWPSETGFGFTAKVEAVDITPAGCTVTETACEVLVSAVALPTN